MKKTMVKAICILLSVLLLIAALPATTFAAKSGDYTYFLDSEGNAEITSVNSGISGDVVIPGKLDGHPVAVIKYDAFRGCTSLTSITIPDSVTEIGSSAFEDCTSLTSITIPDSVTSIGGSAFSGCTSLTSITIPYGVTSICKGTFCNCTSLTKITIPDSLIYIEYNPFINSGYYNNEENWTDGVLYIGNHLIACKQDLSGNYEIKAGTKCIADESFPGCTSLTGITIPDGVTSIGYYAFSGCTSLASITISGSDTGIAIGAFNDTGYYNDADNWTDGVLYIGNYLIKCKEDFSGAYQIKVGTKSIADWAFSYCTSLTGITIPNSVTDIGSSAFEDCTSLTSITIPDSVTEIVSSAFFGCTSLISITIPDSVTSIGGYAFYGCTSLTSITIPDSVTIMGNAAFTGCNNLSDVYYSGTEEQWNNIEFGFDNEDLTSATIHFNSSLHKEHTWSDWTITTPATYTEKGVETRTCSVCGTTETREIPKLGSTTDTTTPPTVQSGDVNGDGKIKANDARIILRIAAGLDTLPEEKIKLADMNGDGKIKANDARVVLRIAAGLE